MNFSLGAGFFYILINIEFFFWEAVILEKVKSFEVLFFKLKILTFIYLTVLGFSCSMCDL